MIRDVSLELSNAQAVTVSANSTNTVNQLAAGQAVGKDTCWLEIRVRETVTADGSATVAFSLETDNAENFGTKKVLASSGAIGKGDLTEGVIAWRVRVPAGAKKYLQVHYAVTDGPLTAGMFDSHFVSDGEETVIVPAPVPFPGPLALGPTSGFATHRMPDMACLNILQVRRVVAGDTVNIYDFQQNTLNYKLTSGGPWIDGSGETFYVLNWYDQTGGTNHVSQYNPMAQPELVLNDENGWPSFVGASGKNLTSSSLSSYIKADLGIMFVYASYAGAPASHDLPYGLPTPASDLSIFGLFRGITPIGGDDKIWAYNYGGGVDKAGAVYSVDTWYAAVCCHVNNLLKIYLDGLEQASVPSNDSASMSNALVVGRDHAGKYRTILFYDVELNNDDIKNISDYCKAH